MQLTIKGVGEQVHVLSHLLAKNPVNLYERVQKDHLVRLFFSKFSENEVEVTVFVTPDPLVLVNGTDKAYDITHYINDREFVVSSIFTSLIRSALATGLNGKPKEEYAEWVSHPFDLTFSFGPVATDLEELTIRELFEPLGYTVLFETEEPDYTFSLKERSSALYISVRGNVTLQNGLQQLFILIPLLDNYKHYYIDEREIEKLERYGEGWLEHHPLREVIIRKTLRFKELYSHFGLTDVRRVEHIPLNELRYERIVEKVKSLSKRRKIVDFGSGEGKLSAKLAFVDGVEEVLAVEPSTSETVKAVKRFERLKEEKEGFIEPIPLWGSVFYFDERLQGKDVMILCEVIEHLDEERLPKVMELILNQYMPATLIITTPNNEFNEVYGMEEERRHEDHRFEWTREQFKDWCNKVKTDDYFVEFEGIGDIDRVKGTPTQMCTFTRKEETL
ncbi:hypothetical protein ACFOZY_04930 [Chungangia koreensis]|uniref:Small RNA 2'-O-methyltransferase n=1 Tax=Chungangia koreensis TaxID=752657 RepID=A0ABV8X418_9LACT